MSSLTERNEKIRLERAKRRHKVTMAFTVTVCTLAAIAIFVYIVNSFINKEYNDYEVLLSNPRQDSNSVRYMSYNQMLLKYSHDGASGINSKGSILWNGSYDMNNPQASACENYVVIGDIGGKELYVYNGTNSGILIEELLPIVQVDVSRQGIVAVVVEDRDSNEIHIYDSNDSGEVLFRIPTNVSEDGYPVDISLSPDGKKLVTSYMAINNGTMESRVTFYNFGEVGKDKENRIVGSEVGDALYPKVKFVSQDMVCLYGENGFKIFSIPELSDEVFAEVFTHPIKSIMYNSKYTGFVLEAYDQEDKYQLLVYDMAGRKILDRKINYEYDQVYFTENEIVFLANLSCTMMRFNGDIKWDYSFDKKMNWIFPTPEKDHYIFIDDMNIEQVKLTEAEE